MPTAWIREPPWRRWNAAFEALPRLIRGHRWLLLLLVSFGIVLGLCAESVGSGPDDLGAAVADFACGLVFIVGGAVAWWRRPGSRSGSLMAATGFAWFVGNFAAVGIGGVDVIAAGLLFLYRGPLIHLLVTYPTGRLGPPREKVVVAVGYATAMTIAIGRSEAASVALVLVVVGVCAAAVRHTEGVARRLRILALVASGLLGLAFVTDAVIRAALSSATASRPSLLAYEAALCVVAGVLLHGLLGTERSPADLADLVVELGESRSRTLRDALAVALGDDTLELGYALPGGRDFVDGEGRPLTLPPAGGERAVAVIERDGAPWLALVHDPLLADDTRLRSRLTTAAELAAANAHLMADVRAQIRELHASQERIRRAGDDERAALDLRLRAGATHELERIGLLLADAGLRAASAATRERIERAAEQLARTSAELERLARGLRPGDLASGLSAALASLAERTPVSVALRLPATPLPVHVEPAVYFVCAEALANIAKHASASRAAVSITTDDGCVTIAVTDDGVGGADAARGTGLRGLADRVAALGGTIRLDSPRGRGTSLVAEIPLSTDSVA